MHPIIKKSFIKSKSLFLTLGLGMAFLIASPVQAQSTDSCTLYMCMAGLSGEGATGGAGCTAALAYWHSALAVYNPYFNSSASASARRNYLMTCPGANENSDTSTNATILNTIITTWGYVP